jgi:prepilin peptidase CpaA
LGRGIILVPDILLPLVVAIAGAFDIRTNRIPNWLTYPSAIAGLVGWSVGQGVPLASAVVGFLVGLVPFLAAYASGWMGGGDVKLMAAVGAMRGFPFVAYAMLYSLFAGALLAILFLIWRDQLRSALADLWRFIRETLTPGMIPAPLATLGGTVPFGVAICFGTLLSIALELTSGMRW